MIVFILKATCILLTKKLTQLSAGRGGPARGVWSLRLRPHGSLFL